MDRKHGENIFFFVKELHCVGSQSGMVYHGCGKVVDRKLDDNSRFGVDRNSLCWPIKHVKILPAKYMFRIC